MKNIVIIFLSFLILSACGTLRTTVKSDSQMSVNTEVQQKDSTATTINQVDLVNTIVDRLDLSKATVIIYNKPDSSGKQTVDRVIEFSNNVQTKITQNREVKKDVQQTSISTSNLKEKTSLVTHQTIEEKKGQSQIKLYIIIIALSVVLLLIAGVWLRKKIL